MSDTFPGSESNDYLARGAERIGGIEGPPPDQRRPAANDQQMQDQSFASRASDLLSALDSTEDSGIILLEELTRQSGKAITVRAKRMTIQELIAADLVPRRAMRVAGFMMEQAEERVKAVRKKWNLPDHVQPTAEQMRADQWTEESMLREALDYFGGSERDATTEATAGVYSFLAAVCCASVVEPRLYLDQDQLDRAKANGTSGAIVWRLPEGDMWKIFRWALSTEARVVRQVDPFPSAVNTPATAPARETVRPDAGNPNDV